MLTGSLAVTSPAVRAEDAESISKLVSEYCLRCHGGESTEADIDLRGPYDQLTLLTNQSLWLNCIQQIRSENMPPDDPIPSAEVRGQWLRLLNRSVVDVDWQAFHHPGRFSLARLTSLEYRHAIRDLFGVDLQAGQLLGNDPEGNTGFTNDRESLTFPIFAFDHFLSEAERVVDAIRTYGRKPWQATIEAEEAWARISDKSTSLNEAESGVILKDRNQPFQVNLDVPYPGLYRLTLTAEAVGEQRLGGMRVVVNGKLTERLVVQGDTSSDYTIETYLTSGSNVVSLGFDPERAPLLQPRHHPVSVPEKVAKLAKPKDFEPLPFPTRFSDDAEAKRAWDRMNNVVKGYLATKNLAELLLRRGDTDYENHPLVEGTAASVLANFNRTKTPFNLSAGKVAVYLGIPQAELERRLEESHGFSHREYVKAVTSYQAAWRKKHPDRVRKKASQISLDRLSVHSHAGIDAGDERELNRLRSFFAGQQESDAAAVIRKLGRHAYGRPLRPRETDTMLGIYRETRDESGSHQEGMRDALIGLLVSPAFLLRYSNAPNGIAASDHELARRLARFLWLSIPDEELLDAADRGDLRDDAELARHVDRMISDARFNDASEAFIEQWLNLEQLRQREDSPSINSGVVMAMREEPVRLLQTIIRKNRPLTELVSCDYTYADALLAWHYGIDGVEGDQSVRVALKNQRRGGLLSMGGILTATSTEQRTSPVTRGAFVVELILGEQLPPAPASVPELKTNRKTKTVREELELHRSAKECAGCHRRIDPFGFALEHYDAQGVWREEERGIPVNARTVLPDGTKVAGLPALQQYIIRERHDDFLRNIAERLFEFALGRSAGFRDEATLRRIVQAVHRDHDKARTLVMEIIRSEAFQSQVNRDAQTID